MICENDRKKSVHTARQKQKSVKMDCVTTVTRIYATIHALTTQRRRDPQTTIAALTALPTMRFLSLQRLRVTMLER